MPASLERFIADLARDFLTGDLDEFASRYTHPVAVYVGREIALELDAAGTRNAVARRRRAATEAGTREILPAILEIAKEADDRFMAIVRWSYRNAGGREIETSLIRYFFRRAPDGPYRIEIVEFLRQGFPGA
jgi:hypothetical protein